MCPTKPSTPNLSPFLGMSSVVQSLQSLGLDLPAPFKNESMEVGSVSSLKGVPLGITKLPPLDPHNAYTAIQQQLNEESRQ